MDGAGDSGVSKAMRLLDALNAQAVPQLNLLAHGPLQTTTAEVLTTCIKERQSVTGTVLGLRVMVEGELYELGVQVVAHPPPLPVAPP